MICEEQIKKKKKNKKINILPGIYYITVTCLTFYWAVIT